MKSSSVVLLLLLGCSRSFTDAGRALAPAATHIQASPGSHVQNPWTPHGTASQTPTPVPQRQHVQEATSAKAPAPGPQQRTDPISNLLNAIPQLFSLPSASGSGASVSSSDQQVKHAALASTSQSQQQRPSKASPSPRSSNAHGTTRSPAAGTQSFKSRPMMPLRLPFEDLFPADPLGLHDENASPVAKDTTSLRQKNVADDGPADLPPLFRKPPDLFDDLYAGNPEQSFKEQVPMPDPLPIPDAVLEAAADGDPFPLPDPADDSPSGPVPDAPKQETSAEQSSDTQPSVEASASPSGPSGDSGSSAVPSTTNSFQSQGGGFLPSLPELLGLPGTNPGSQQLPTSALPQFPRFPTIPRFRPLSLFPGLDPDEDGGDLEPIGRSRSSSSPLQTTSRLATRTSTATPSSTASKPSAKPSPAVRVIRVHRRAAAPVQGTAPAQLPAAPNQAAPARGQGAMRLEAPQITPPRLPLVAQAGPTGPARAPEEPDDPIAQFAGGTRTPHVANRVPASANASPVGVPTSTSFHQVTTSEGFEDKDLLAALASATDAGPMTTADAVQGVHQSLLQTPAETGTTGAPVDAAAQAALGETLADVLGAALVEGTRGSPPEADAGASLRSDTSGAAETSSTQRPASIAAPAPAPTVPRASPNLSLQEKRTPKVESAAWWVGQAIPRSAAGPAPAPGSLTADAAEDITSLAQLEGLSGDQLMDVFSHGVPDIPSATPGSNGTYTVCTGEALAPAALQSGAPSELNEGLRAAVHALWTGKVLRTDPAANKTTVWNLMYTNNSVAIVGVISRMEPGLSEDSKPSAVVDYTSNENVLLRAVRDELRRVGPNMWLGRGWLTSAGTGSGPLAAAANAQTPQALRSAAESLSSSLNIPIPGTAAASGSGGSSSHPELGDKVPTLFFGLECRDLVMPRLVYTPLAQLQEGANRVTGPNTNYALPAINSRSTNAAAAAPQVGAPETLDPATLGPFANLTDPLAAFRTVFGDLSQGAGLPAQQINLPALPLPSNSNVLQREAPGLLETASSALAIVEPSPASGSPGGPPVGIPRPTVAPILNPIAALMDDPVAAGSSNIAAGLLSAVQSRALPAVPPVASVVAAVTGNQQVGAVAGDIASGLNPVAGQLLRDGLGEAREALQSAATDSLP